MLHRFVLLHHRPLLPALGISVLVILVVVVMGLSLSASAQGVPELSVSKTASKIYVHPNEVVTYTISLRNTGTASASVTLTDTVPFEVTYVPGSATGGATHSDGKVTWSGTVDPGNTKVITFQVIVAEPETLGPLPIVNTACADDGTDMVCDWIVIYSRRYKVFLPCITKNHRPGSP